MGYYILKRSVFIVIVLWMLTMVTFYLTIIAPSDPAALWVGPRPKQGQLEQARKELGLDRPAYVRYFHYLNNLLHGDFGTSIRTRQPMAEELKRYFAATIELVTVSIIISLIVGIPLEFTPPLGANPFSTMRAGSFPSRAWRFPFSGWE